MKKSTDRLELTTLPKSTSLKSLFRETWNKVLAWNGSHSERDCIKLLVIPRSLGTRLAAELGTTLPGECKGEWVHGVQARYFTTKVGAEACVLMTSSVEGRTCLLFDDDGESSLYQWSEQR